MVRFPTWAGILILALALSFGSASAFTAPTVSPGVGGGSLQLDASGNLGVGTSSSTPISTFNATSTESGSTAHGKVFMVASSTNPGIGLKNLSSGNTYLWSARNFGNLQLYRESGVYPGFVILDINQFGDVSIGTSTPSSGGSARLTVGGSIAASAINATLTGNVPASGVTTGVFSSGNFAFQGALGVGTTSLVGLPTNGLLVTGTTTLATAAGNVGIGTAAPDQKLQVAGNIRLPVTGGKIAFGTAGSTPTDYLMLQDVSSPTPALEFSQDSSAKFVIQGQTGNVGIGTSTPNSKLHVYSGNIFISNTTTPTLTLNNISGGTTGEFALRVNGENFEILEPEDSSRLAYKISEAGASSDRFVHQLFYDGTNVAIQTDLNGNVGVRTSNPSSSLHVVGSTTITDDIYLSDSKSIRLDSGSNTTLLIANYNSGGFAYGTGQTASLAVEGDVKGNRLCFGDADCKSSWSEIVTGGGGGYWLQSGSYLYPSSTSWSVGIGTATPTSKLHVSGSGAGDGTWTDGILIQNSNATAGEAALAFNNISTGSNYWLTGLNQNDDYSIAYGTGFTDPNTKFRITAESKVGIGVLVPVAKLDVSQDNGEFSLILGADVNASTRTDATRKFARIGMPHYTNSEEPVTILTADSDGTNNYLNFGGATTSGNSPTAIRFFTAANNTTLTGTERMRLSATGGLSIGNSYITTDPGAGSVIVSGNVGIGTTTPATELHVISASGNAATFNQPITIGYPVASTDAARKDYVDTVAGVAQSAFWTQSGSNLYPSSTSWRLGVGLTAPTSSLTVSEAEIAAGDFITPFEIRRSWSSGSTTPRQTGLIFTDSNSVNGGVFAVRTNSAGNYRSDLAFFTNSGSSSMLPSSALTERLRIDYLGNVGIGTTTPANTLHVAGSGRIDGALNFRPTGGANPSYSNQISVQDATNYNGRITMTMAGGSDYFAIAGTSTADNGILEIATGDNGNEPITFVQYNAGTPAERVRIANTGFVGIGTTTPATQLHVVTSSGNAATFSSPITVGYPVASTDAARKDYVDAVAGIAQSASWVQSGSYLYPSSTSWSVAIGTTTPYGKLHLVGIGYSDQNTGADTATNPTTTTAGGFVLDGSYSNGQYRTRLVKIDRGGNLPLYVQDSYGTANSFNNVARFGSHSYSNNKFEVFGNTAISGNLGLGTTSASSLLHLSGNAPVARFQDNTHASSSNSVDGYILFADSANSQYGYIGDGSTGTNNIDIYGGTTHGVSLFGGGVRGLNVNTSGNVGVGTTTFTGKFSASTEGAWNLGDTYPFQFINLDGAGNEGDGLLVRAGSLSVNSNIFTVQDYNGVNKLNITGDGIATFSSPLTIAYPVASTDAARKDYVDANFAPIGGASGIWIQSGSNLYPSSTSWNVGIGTTTPTTGLEVIRAYSNNTGQFKFKTDISESTYGWIGAGTGGVVIGADNVDSGAGIAFWTGTGASSEKVRITDGGSVGIGTTTPATELHVISASGNAATFNQPITIGYPVASTDAARKDYVDTVAGVAQSAFWTQSGSNLYPSSTSWRLGVGLTNPAAPLNVYGTSSLATSTETVRLTAPQNYTAGFGPKLSFWNGTSEQLALITGSIQNTGNGNFGRLDFGTRTSDALGVQTKVSILANGSVGIGTTTPAHTLSVLGGNITIQPGQLIAAGLGYDSVTSAASSSIELYNGSTGDLTIRTGYSNGDILLMPRANVGIGTTTPATELHVVTASGNAATFSSAITIGYPVASTDAARKDYVDSAVNNGNATSSKACNGDATCEITNADFGGTGNITGVNKLTVTTIDPLYEIKGKKYSTYTSAIAGGVKEEYVGRGEMKKVASGKWQMALDFDSIKDGSDLWVWKHTVDFSPENVEILATPIGVPVPVAYEIRGNKIVFFSESSSFKSSSISFSYRLIGKRVDWAEWPTFAKDQSERANFIIK